MSKQTNKQISVTSKFSHHFALLRELYTIHSPSKGEDKMRSFITDYLDKLGVHYQQDKRGCIYSLNQGIPLLSAHMDQVQKAAPSQEQIKEDSKYISAQGIGLGADDKNGIWIILKELEHCVQNNHLLPSFLFSVEEESLSGKAGESFEEHFLDDKNNPLVPFAIVLDRRGSSDIIGADNGYCSDTFELAIEQISKQHKVGYTPCMGAYSDADALSEYVNCVNLSVGYYHPHSTDELTDKKDILRAWWFVQLILQNADELAKIPFEGKKDWWDKKWDKKWDRNWNDRWTTKNGVYLSDSDKAYLEELLIQRQGKLIELTESVWDDAKESDSEENILARQAEYEEEYQRIEGILGALY